MIVADRPKNDGARVGKMILAGLLGAYIVLRLWLHTQPDSDLSIAGYNIHHLFTGLLLMIGAMLPLLILRPSGRFADTLSIILGVGLGMTLDEWVYLIVTDGSNASYLLPVSLWGSLGLILLCAACIALLIRLRSQ